MVEAPVHVWETNTGASYSTVGPALLVGVEVLRGGGGDNFGDTGRCIHASGGGGGLCGGGVL